MTVTERLLDCASDVWARYHSHPFVLGLGDGTLDVEKFKYYMVQDYLYLFDYARVFALGVVKARDEQTMRQFAGYVHQILEGEMELHRGYMARLGIPREEAEAAAPAQDNLSYTAYMLRVAWEEGPAEIAACILACALSYEHIARRILEGRPEAADHPLYGEWVRGYADAGYSAANRELSALTERLAAGYDEAGLGRLEEFFLRCSRYELAFWDMAWEARGWDAAL